MNIPEHIAIIMDGNGRWADKKSLPKIAGHAKGVSSVEKILNACIDLGVKNLTLYTFSTENWKRSELEIKGLMELLYSYLHRKKKDLMKRGIRLMVSGDIKGLPDRVYKKIKEVKDLTAKNENLVLNLALNYGSRQEIVRAIKKIAQKVKKGSIEIEDIDEKIVSKNLYTKSIPDPDLLIRTSGEYRLSNFLLWQLSYAEFYVTKKFWPDFCKKDLKEAIEDFNKRQRRFGGR